MKDTEVSSTAVVVSIAITIAVVGRAFFVGEESDLAHPIGGVR